MTSKELNYMLTVEEGEAGVRLDKFLTQRLPEYSRARLQGLIEQGQVTSQGQEIAPSQKVKIGQIFSITIPELIDPIPQPENIPLDIVYNDKDIIIINKPAGMVVHPAPGNYNSTLVNALLAHCGDSLSGINGVKRPGILHRLDKETSGLLIVAKNDKAHQQLALQMAQRTIHRVYQAIVWGRVSPPEGTIDLPLGRHPVLRKKIAVRKIGGKNAVTHYRLLKSFGLACSLVECRLETGRTHQIRVHMASSGHSLLGDVVYGKIPSAAPSYLKDYLKGPDWKKDRHALHAKSIAFIHPTTQKTLFFETELPNDMLALLTILESHALKG